MNIRIIQMNYGIYCLDWCYTFDLPIITEILSSIAHLIKINKRTSSWCSYSHNLNLAVHDTKTLCSNETPVLLFSKLKKVLLML